MKSILFIDSDIKFVDLLRPFFPVDSFKITQVGDADRGVDMLRAEQFDIIVANNDAPGVGQFQIVQKVKETVLNRHSTVMVLFKVVDESLSSRVKHMKTVNLESRLTPPDQLSRKILDLIESTNYGKYYSEDMLEAVRRAGSDLIQFFFKERPATGLPFVKRVDEQLGYALGSVEIENADYHGVLSISADRTFFEWLNARIFGRLELPLSDRSIQDLCGEMCNQMTGLAQMNFNRVGIDVKMGLPKTLCRKAIVFPANGTAPIVAFPISVAEVSCHIEFVMNKKAAQKAVG